MDRLVAKNQKEVEEYRQTIFKSKEECRRLFAEEPFENKIRIAFELYRQAEYLKKFKPQRRAARRSMRFRCHTRDGKGSR